MRNAMLQLILVLVGVTGVHAVKLMQTSSIHTKVLPAESAERVWAIHGKDTIKMMESDDEYYLTTAAPGAWQIHIEARKPFLNASIHAVEVKPGTTKELGEIWLQR